MTSRKIKIGDTRQIRATKAIADMAKKKAKLFVTISMQPGSEALLPPSQIKISN